MSAFTFIHVHENRDEEPDSTFRVEASAEWHSEHCPGSFMHGPYCVVDLQSVVQIDGPWVPCTYGTPLWQACEREADGIASEMGVEAES